MTIGDTDNFIRFELAGMAPEYLPTASDMAYAVEMRAFGFGGRDAELWFERGVLGQFLEDMVDLEAKRQGVATPTDYSYSSSYDGFRMRLYSVDSLGHLGVQADLQRSLRIGPELQSLKVSVAFEIDPTTLPGIVRECQDLFDHAAQTRRADNNRQGQDYHPPGSRRPPTGRSTPACLFSGQERGTGCGGGVWRRPPGNSARPSSRPARTNRRAAPAGR